MKRTLSSLGLTLTLACLTFAGILPAVHAAGPKVRTYTVQPGDSIWSIAAEFYGNGDKYQLIYKNNKFIGLAPYILKPGQVLTLPEGEVTPEAQVAWMRKEVKAKPPRSLDWLEASNKMNLWKQYQVSTGDESAVHIVFEDTSDLSLGDNAIMVIYGGSIKNAKTRERTKTQVLLREGTVRGGLAALDGKVAPLQVDTPSGTIEMNSTDAQIQCDEAGSVVSVYEGEVEVKAGGTSVKIPKDHGTVVAKGKKPEAPRALPAPPAWNVGTVGGGSESAAVAIVPAGGRATFEAAWTAVPAAKTYRIELAHDERFKNVVVSVEVDAKTTRFLLEQVPVGRYHARVSARDASKLQGRPSTALQIDVVGINASRRMSQDETGRWEVAGFARLDLGKLGDGLEWALDDADFSTGNEPKRVMGNGGHSLKVRRVGQSVTTTFPFHVLAIRGALDLGPKGRLEAGGSGRELTLTVTDEKGRPASVPDVILETDPPVPGGALVLVPAGPGRWTAHLPAPAPPGPRELLVRASWSDGVLARGYLEVERKLLEPYLYHWREAVQPSPWDGRLASTPLPSIVPIDRVGSTTILGSQADALSASLTLHGEAALVDNTLGIDAALTFFHLSLGEDVSGVSELGDAVIGLRYLVLRTKYVTLAPSLRARLPFGPGEGVGLGLEPSIIARFRLLERLWVDTRQGVLSAFGSEGDRSYIADYALVLLPFGIDGVLGLSAQLTTVVSFDDLPVALGLGAGVHANLGRVRLGLVAGFGLGDEGAARFGDFRAGVTLDFGLGTP